MVATRSELARSDDNTPITYATSGSATTYFATYDINVYGGGSGGAFRLGTKTGTTVTNYGYAGAQIHIKVDNHSGATMAASVELQNKDLASGDYITIFSGGAISASGSKTYWVHPHWKSGAEITQVNEENANLTFVTGFLTREYRIKVHNNVDSWASYTVGISPVK